MFQDEYRQPPAAIPFRVTYSPAHLPSGVPLDPRASRQTLAERVTTTITAPTADAATWAFERDHNRMVTACTRLQAGDEDDA